jgi:hypothetical protein
MKSSIISLLLSFMPLIFSGCLSGDYINPSASTADSNFKCEWLHTNNEAQFAIEGRLTDDPKKTKFLVCEQQMSQAITDSIKSNQEIGDTILSKEELLRDQPVVSSIPAGFHREKAIHGERGRDVEISHTEHFPPPSSLNLLWSVPLDVITSPIQLIIVVVNMATMHSS